MATGVLAETTKVKNNFINGINGKKKFKIILSCLFGGRRKVQVTNLPSRTSSVVGSAANSVGTTLEFTAFGSGPDAKPGILVPSGFFCPQPWFLRRSEHIFPGKKSRVYRNTLTCVTPVTSNRAEVHRLNSQHLA